MKKFFSKDFKRKVKYALPERVRVGLESEYIIVSYPKCGRSWLRVMLTEYVREKYGIAKDEYIYENALSKYSKDLNDVSFTHDDEPCFKNYQNIAGSKKAYSNKKVIFLMRNPIDTAVSWFYQLTDRGSKKWLKDPVPLDDINKFVKNDVGALKSIVTYFNLWLAKREVPKDFMIVKYEDVKLTTVDELVRIMEFLGFKNVDKDVVGKVVDQTEFSKLKKKEKEGLVNDIGFVQKGEQQGAKVRKGKIKGYVDELNPDTVSWAEMYVQKHLDESFGYY